MTFYVCIVLGIPEGGLSQTKCVSDHCGTHFHIDLQMMLPYTRTPCGSVHFHVDFPTFIGKRGDCCCCCDNKIVEKQEKKGNSVYLLRVKKEIRRKGNSVLH